MRQVRAAGACQGALRASSSAEADPSELSAETPAARSRERWRVAQVQAASERNPRKVSRTVVIT